MVKHLKTKTTDNSIHSSEMDKNDYEMNNTTKSEEIDFDMQSAVDRASHKFLHEVLPKVPSMANGMKILGVPEISTLTKTGEVYKMRIAHPNRPIGMSEVWDDRMTLRMTTFAKLISDELQLMNFRIEMACLVPGAVEKDVIGTKAVKGLYEASDAGKLTIKPFLQRKITGSSESCIYSFDLSLEFEINP